MFNPTFSSRSGTETLPSVEAMMMVLPEEDGTNSFDKSTLIVRMFPSTVICTFFIRRSPAGEYLPRAPVKFLWEQLSSPTCSRGARQSRTLSAELLVGQLLVLAPGTLHAQASRQPDRERSEVRRD